MGRTQAKAGKKSRAQALAALAPPALSTAPKLAPAPQESTQELLLKAAQFINEHDFDAAKVCASDAVRSALAALERNAGELEQKDCTDSFEILGTVELELGELDLAKEHFLTSISHSSSLPSPSPAPHLYLAQLSTPIESLAHFSAALKILQNKLLLIESAKLGTDGGAGSVDEAEEEEELRRSASRALVGMTELYLTDLCFEEEAEMKCEENLELALEIDPTDPEVYQVLASVRLSQERNKDARAIILEGLSLFEELEADSPDYPPYTTRLAYAQRLLEVSEYAPALQVLQRLENEDDEDLEIWYLSGWSWWLLGESRGEDWEGEDGEEGREECWSEGRLCLENFLRLHERDPEVIDPEQLAHVQELMEKFEAAGVVASTGQGEGGEEWEDDSEGGEDDVEMQG